ncbi:MAG: chorismate-binding protein [Flavobacteriaceae bacterium]|nr:chorismate-binding protein [Flavobacteriaceae bacterium]
MKKLRDTILKALQNDFPFVVYRKPSTTKILGVFQRCATSEVVEELDEEGFLFAPFDDSGESFIIPFKNANKINFEQVSIEINTSNPETPSDENKKQHISLVESGIDFIKKSKVEKVVLSRKEEVNIHDFNEVSTFMKLCNCYPNAFVYLWNHPKTGMWMGASPERLLSIDDRKFKVMALASTQEYKGDLEVNWGAKEKEEHQYVVDYIAAKIQNFDLSISETYTVKAGDLLHLRADISGVIPFGVKSKETLIKVLHPTPAICGLPKEESKLFILENENYNREYYTGYLGELKKDSTDLFVNLRCMKVDLKNKKVNIYVGGGITKDSNSEKEWLETVAKTGVMKKVL